MTAAKSLRGHCLCGAVEVHVEQRASAATHLVYCHCEQCRRSSGSDRLAVFPAPRESVTIHDPNGCLASFASSAGKQRRFCQRCGTPVLSERDGASQLRLRAGLFEDLGEVVFDGHIYASARVDWARDFDDGPHHAGVEPGRVR